ncbi:MULTISPECIES: FAD/NAD(P)-binding protein [unclassified Mesorhizobium]|uniref:FAD/NAD(P)-binding protein n=1 Tax=unclassified Mesorhizobium TaxID=325217 RepID=UPI000FCC86B7|nr:MULTISPECIES: FAD/NAD(P)-binding protein [unclassified Mesorhizobium]RUW32829.1 FAD-dependent oxidoreductase [Mesorhizobium sp. M1E.F.Ca.ET.041.01.1.1]RWD91876.1 MAG: FAD-dependent oxidoreductase [Mesorhizobium sp.]RWD95767.1 MAG: FAD-dependent oxidoreductase [Mesorhizobium sp.]TIV54847.1 MAG: FAD-dependent oxidoreductase [Mesorhizobium sp.]
MNALPPQPRSHVVILGGGFSGAAVAWHLARQPARHLITVVEPRPLLGGGLAYSSEEPSHRVNVPAARMSLVPDEPEHFLRWLARDGEAGRDPDSVWRNGDTFPRRRVFGRYVTEQLAPFVETGTVRHLRDDAREVRRSSDGGWTVFTSDQPISADVVVLAMTHPSPDVPTVLKPIANRSGFIADVYVRDALGSVAPEAPVLIVGSGLTSADTVAELDRRGHRGRILAVSRHGLRSRGHPDVRGEAFGDFVSAPASTALALLERVRSTLAAAEAAGVNWQSVFDQLRQQGPVVWSALGSDERTRLVRRLRVFWDVHRFRIAPQVASVLDRRRTEGTFENIAASLVASSHDGDRLAVSLRRRGQRQIETLRFDAVINTTGPAHGKVLQVNPALRSLADAGLIRVDRHGLGIETDLNSRAVGPDGAPLEGLFVAGPLARGTFGELMGLPEVARHAQVVASEIKSRLGALPSIATGR